MSDTKAALAEWTKRSLEIIFHHYLNTLDTSTFKKRLNSLAKLAHIFGINVGNDFGILLRCKGPHKPEFAYDIVRKHSIMIYTDLIECNIFGYTKAPLLRCFLFISKLKERDIITTG